MKKRIASIVCAAMLMLALPTLAWAADSPSGTSASVNGTQLVVSGATDGITVAIADGPAQNVPDGVQGICSYRVSGTIPAGQTLTLTFYVGAENAGRTATIYIQHGDDGNVTGTETQTATVAADGTITITVDKLSIFTVVLGDKAQDAATTTAADKSAKSPATGVDMGVVAGGSVVALCGAGVVAVALRKKVTE